MLARYVFLNHISGCCGRCILIAVSMVTSLPCTSILPPVAFVLTWARVGSYQCPWWRSFSLLWWQLLEVHLRFQITVMLPSRVRHSRVCLNRTLQNHMWPNHCWGPDMVPTGNEAGRKGKMTQHAFKRVCREMGENMATETLITQPPQCQNTF